jgi:hypothetical protein
MTQPSMMMMARKLRGRVGMRMAVMGTQGRGQGGQLVWLKEMGGHRYSVINNWMYFCSVRLSMVSSVTMVPKIARYTL